MTHYRFSRPRRLLSEDQFQPVFRTPDIRVGGDHLLLLARSNGLEIARLGLVVGRRRVRLAVHRNRIKRQTRESFRLRQHSLTGLDIIVLVRAPWMKPARQAIRSELEPLWDKLLAKRSQA